MILADKILNLRKRNGMSQEELAEKLQVSRQSVSKWEIGASIPDINKILDIARLFGVSTDYLLKDEMEEENTADMTEEPSDGPAVSIEEANEYMRCKEAQGKRIGFGVVLCILSPVTMILLAGLSESGRWAIQADMAAGVGTAILLVMVSAAVAIFISSGQRMKHFEYLKKSDFKLDYGIYGIVEERLRKYEPVFTRRIIFGVTLCIVAAIPLIVAGSLGASELVSIGLVGLLLSMIALAVYLMISAGEIKSSYEQLMKAGDYDPEVMRRNRPFNRIAAFYWPVVTALYLGWSFWTMNWAFTWLVWPVAGCLFAGLAAVVKRDKDA